MVRHGAVAIAGEVCEDPFIELDPQGLEFTVDGEPWRYREHAYLMLHKPQGYECSRAPKHHPSIFSLLPDPLVGREVQSVGRLDEDTTGLLLLTDDGQFIHALTSPKRKVAKVYAVTTKHPVDEAQLAQLRRGVQLHDEPKPIAAAACERIDDHLIHLTLIEGKYHQVKRMLAAAGNRVEALRRIAIGGLALPDDLEAGEWRWLEPADLELLWRHD
jgi:16S rRNA pseudouridine516 synthase